MLVTDSSIFVNQPLYGGLKNIFSRLEARLSGKVDLALSPCQGPTHGKVNVNTGV